MNRVVLVGAGCGSGMLTLRGAALLQACDCVVYDSLLDESILGMVKPSCRKIFAGKRAGRHSLPQEEINALLLSCAGRYPLTVRLKGGDPCVFGRGGEEAAALAAAGVACEFVPGVTSAVAAAGIVRTRDLRTWERLPDLRSASQQRNVVLHPEFVDGKYALYTRPQDGFIDAGRGGGIGWALVEDMTRAEVREETIIDCRQYHTIKELKNGEGPHPIRTSRGWLHMAHGVRGCAAGLRYVLYLYLTDLHRPERLIAEPAGYFMAPQGAERVGDVSNVLFCNGWIADEDGTVYIYYASADTRLHVATTSVDRLLDYCLHTPPDGLRSACSVAAVKELIARNRAFLRDEASHA